MTESPRRNIFDMNLSLLTGLDLLTPFPLLGVSVHISLTFSSTMLQWRSLQQKHDLLFYPVPNHPRNKIKTYNALTLARSLRLFLLVGIGDISSRTKIRMESNLPAHYQDLCAVLHRLVIQWINIRGGGCIDRYESKTILLV